MKCFYCRVPFGSKSPTFVFSTCKRCGLSKEMCVTCEQEYGETTVERQVNGLDDWHHVWRHKRCPRVWIVRLR